jgi:hypothetical protein
MPDYQFNTQLTPNVQQTSLGDMLNLARGVQAYQQAQQINPLEVESRQIAIQQAKEMNPMLLAEQATRVKKGKFEYSAQQTQALNEIAGGILNDPRLNSKNPKEITNVLSEAKDRASALFEDDPDGENKINGVFQPLMKVAISKPELTPQIIKSMVQQGLGATGQQSLQTPTLTTSGGQPALFRTGPGTVESVQVAPSQETAPTTGGAPAQAVTQTQMQLPYKVRQPGDITPMSLGEESDRTTNQAYRQGIVNRQLGLTKARRNLNEVIQEATKLDPESFWSKGTAGDVLRKLRTMGGDVTYKQLSKDLANAQIANIQAVGGSMDTVSGQNLAKLANGDETYPPEVLINIARRTFAELQDIDLQAKGAEKFAKKYGDNNLNWFKQKWAENSDSKVFEAISIYNNVKDPAERKKAIDSLLGSNPKERAEFADKFKKIQKLSETGEL